MSKRVNFRGANIPIDVLRIDQSFVRPLVSPFDKGAIVKAVIGMSRSLNLNVVAEGVETKEQCQFLRALKCDEGQGFYFSRPLAADKFARLLRRGLPARRNVVSPPGQRRRATVQAM